MPSTQKYFALRSPRASSASRPLMTVNYISHAGGERPSATQGAGRAGEMRADLFSGNLVHAHPDTAMSGSRLPIGVTHYYNSCQIVVRSKQFIVLPYATLTI
jgi:hypothetical protein